MVRKEADKDTHVNNVFVLFFMEKNDSEWKAKSPRVEQKQTWRTTLREQHWALIKELGAHPCWSSELWTSYW